MSGTTSAIQQMKRANKYDKSISAKHKILTRQQQELKALKARVPKKRKPLVLNLEAIGGRDVLEFKKATKAFDGPYRQTLSNKI